MRSLVIFFVDPQQGRIFGSQTLFTFDDVKGKTYDFSEEEGSDSVNPGDPSAEGNPAPDEQADDWNIL